MLACLACYGDRVAVLLDTATELRLYRRDGTGLAPCGVSPVPPGGVLALIDLLAAAHVDLLICGGLSGCAQAALRQSGVAVAGWVGGAAEDVIRAWVDGGMRGIDALRLPGCCPARCRAGRPACRGRARALRLRRSTEKELNDD